MDETLTPVIGLIDFGVQSPTGGSPHVAADDSHGILLSQYLVGEMTPVIDVNISPQSFRFVHFLDLPVLPSK